MTTAIFERLVRGEFHFEPASNIKQIAAWDAWWPDVEAAVVVDRTGELTAIVASQPRAPRRNATQSQSEFVVDSLCNWTVMGLHLLARGELARSMDVLNLLHAHLLTAVRIVEGAPLTWHGSRHLEAHLSTSSYERYRRCTQLELTRAGLGRAYAATWDWSRDLMAELSTSFAHDARSRVVGLIDGLMDTTIGTGRTDPAHRPPGRE